MPLALVALVIVGFCGFTVRVKSAIPWPIPLVAEMFTAVVPMAVGVPLISPVLVFTLNPAGNPVALNDVGELLAVIV
jgi:hypothetical protein